MRYIENVADIPFLQFEGKSVYWRHKSHVLPKSSSKHYQLLVELEYPIPAGTSCAGSENYLVLAVVL